MSEPNGFSPVAGVQTRCVDRRASLRHPCEFDTACHPIPEGDLLCFGRVQDISTTGIGLLVHCYVEPETLLSVELQSEDGSLAYSLLIEVRSARQQPEGEWLLGCLFARQLSTYELSALL